METNFFQQVNALHIKGDLHLIIRKEDDNSVVVSIWLNNEQCGDDAKNLIPPLTFRATAEELDKVFFETITRPIQQTSALMVNMEAFIKQLEIAKAQSAMEKEKTDRAKKDKDSKEKAYKDAMQKADELANEGKYKEAWMKTPKTADYPEYADIISKRKDDFARHFAPSLFENETDNEEIQSENQP